MHTKYIWVERKIIIIYIMKTWKKYIKYMYIFLKKKTLKIILSRAPQKLGPALLNADNILIATYVEDTGILGKHK
jgi:hypothetical protein